MGEWETGGSSRWHALAARVLDNYQISPEEGLAILRSPDEQLLDLLAAAYRVRYRWFGNRVHLNFLINAKSGMCGEDCGYCSQSRVSRAEIPVYDLVDPQEILAGAKLAAERRAGTYCIVVSGRAPGQRELETIAAVVPRIKATWNLKICVSPGLLTLEQAVGLKACGVDRVNHNLNTGERFYPKICTTHTYQQRWDTLRAVRQAGLEICSGGIIGMGEEDADVVELALRLAEIRAEAIPVNFLIPIPGTRLEGAGGFRGCPETGTGTLHLAQGRDPRHDILEPVPVSGQPLNPRYCLKVLALFRLANPRCELRIAAGRELHLGSLQAMGLYPASSIFVGDYLTTKGRAPDEDYRMLEALGFEAVLEIGGRMG